MILSGLSIIEEINKKTIWIDPYDPKKINPNSYNLSLNNDLLVYEDEVLDMKKENKCKKITIPEDGFLMVPNKIYLGRTVEKTKTDKFVPMLEGRSSIGRLGLIVHVTAGFGDIGFNGFWTLELACFQPIIIYPYVEVCQIYFHTVIGKSELYKSNKYQNNNEIQSSLLYKEFSKNS